MGDLRGGPGAQARGSACAGSSGSVSGDAQPAGLHSQAGWTAAPAGGRRAGGQDRPTGDGDGAEREYEEDFLGFSYGFRPGRGAHDAMDALVVGITTKKVNWILDADIEKFFDSVSQEWLIRFVEHRIGDKRIIRLIQKWLKAGVLEDGVVTTSDRGTGQGSVISPLLANIYLHYVFDLWAERWRRREATGDMIIVRYADDIIVGFRARDRRPALPGRDARKVREVCVDAASGQDPPDRVRPLRGGQARAARARQTGDLQLPRLHLHLRQIARGRLPDQTEDPSATACGRS